MDAHLVCVQSSPLLTRAIGAEAAGVPEQGYGHYFRNQAEKLNPQGPAGELAGLASLADPCYLKGKGPWPDLEIKKGEVLLQRFPADTWTPWIHYAIARSHAVKLSFSYPDGDPEGSILPLKPAEMQRERELAIDHFESLKQVPDDPKSVFRLAGSVEAVSRSSAESYRVWLQWRVRSANSVAFSCEPKWKLLGVYSCV